MLGPFAIAAHVAMSMNEPASNQSRSPNIWQRIGIFLILSLPLIFVCGGFLLLPAPAAQRVYTAFETSGSIFRGLAAETFWQGVVLFGWFVLVCFYVASFDFSLQRSSISAAFAAVFLIVALTSILLHQQHRIAIATADSYD